MQTALRLHSSSLHATDPLTLVSFRRRQARRSPPVRRNGSTEAGQAAQLGGHGRPRGPPRLATGRPAPDRPVLPALARRRADVGARTPLARPVEVRARVAGHGVPPLGQHQPAERVRQPRAPPARAGAARGGGDQVLPRRLGRTRRGLLRVLPLHRALGSVCLVTRSPGASCLYHGGGHDGRGG